MCTIMFYPETRPAEKRSRKDSQKAVDRLMEYDRQLSEPFTREELKNIFSERVFDRGEYDLLTDDEKNIVEELGLTPPPRKNPDRDPIARTDGIPAEPPSVPQRRRCLKAEQLDAPGFDGHPFGISLSWTRGDIYVWLDNCCFGNSDKKGFYYVRYQRSMLAWGSTAYAHPVLIVQKNKLRPDQVEFMERKCRETNPE